MLVGGEKYACDACIRGHRVSSCTHKDRKLNHVNKKGRPLSQCPHCRGLRKSRSTHIKCDCGEGAHTRGSSSERESGCRCQNGSRCVCSMRKGAAEPEDAQHVLQKPSIPGHHSDSAIPRIKPPVNPYMHRLHRPHHNVHATHNTQDGQRQPYTTTRPRAFTDASQTSPSSYEGSELSRPSSTIHQGSPAPMLYRQLSNPLHYSAPRSRPALPPLRVNSPSPLPDFLHSVDASTMYKAISPGNPARYSFHDLGQLGLENFVPMDQQQQYAENDDLINVDDEDWRTAFIPPAASEPNPNIRPQPITPSELSIDYSLSSQFGISSIGTTSEPGTEMSTMPAKQDFAFRSMPINNSEPLQPVLEIKASGGPPTWIYDNPAYAASDPGAYNPVAPMDGMAFMDDGLQRTETAPANFVDQDMNSYGLDVPLMSDEAVREWVSSHPTQLNDPTFDFEVSRQYMPQPTEAGSYAWN